MGKKLMQTMLFIVLYLFIELLTYLKFKTIFKMNLLLNSQWTLGIIVTEFNLAGINSISEYTKLSIFVMLIIFNSIYLIRSKGYCIQLNGEKCKEYLNSIDFSLLYWANYFSYIFISTILLKAIKIIATQGFAVLRSYAYVNSDLLVTGLQSRISIWIVYPIFIITIILGSIAIVSNMNNTKLKVLLLIDVGIYIVSFGGRVLIVTALVYILFSYIVWKSITKEILHLSLKYKFLLIIASSLLLYLISLRKWNGLSVFDNLLVYLVGSVSYLNILIETSDIKGILLGRGIFGLILNPILYVYSLFSHTRNLTSEYILQEITDVFVSIGNCNFNALPTMLYVFWADGGMIGIISGTIVLAFIVTWLENRFYKTFNIKNFMLYLYAVFSVYESTINYSYYKITTFFLLLFIILFGTMFDKKAKRKLVEK